MTDLQQQGTGFFLCARQCDHGQDHDAASRVGCGAKRGAGRRPVQLRMDRRQPVHVAQGRLGRDFRNQVPRQDHVHRCGHQEEIVLRLHRQRQALPACRLRQVDDANGRIEALIGSRYVTLNNSIQDKSYIKQTLGYRMLDMADLPNSRCNYARVFVNGMLIGQGVGGVNSPGIYVNAEPIMKQLHRAQFQRKYERQSVRARASRRFPRREAGSSSGWKPSPNSRTKPI